MKSSILALLLCILALTGCERQTMVPVHQPANAVYYWRNNFQLSDEENKWLSAHKVTRMYVRFFDVIAEDRYSGEGMQPLPSASVHLDQMSLSGQMEYVPTVFITVNALKLMADDPQLYAGKIVTRISAMCRTNEVPNVHEIQLDCDWTSSTRESFHELCRQVRCALPDSMLLSCTIRLHQLHQTPPPVDYGVLMLYNTGAFDDIRTSNSILQASDVEPYLEGVPDYRLPLDFAFPAFNWKILFRDGVFRQILYDDPPHLEPGDSIREETASFGEIMKTKQLLDKYLPIREGRRSNIIYHLSPDNIKKFSSNEVYSIYH